MAKAARTVKLEKSDSQMTLAEALSVETAKSRFSLWLVGMTPLICHAWSEKNRQEMVAKQVGASRGAKEARDPHEDFVSSLYHLPDGNYGFPAMGVKASWIDTADKSKGLAKSGAIGANSSIWLDAPILAKQRTAVPGAVSDMPVVRVWTDADPQMREDPVRLAGKTASFAYRAQLWPWAIRVTGSFNPSIISPMQFVTLIKEGGQGIGIGDWRPQRRGMFGTYRLAAPGEDKRWDEFAAGTGPCPVDVSDGGFTIMPMAAE